MNTSFLFYESIIVRFFVFVKRKKEKFHETLHKVKLYKISILKLYKLNKNVKMHKNTEKKLDLKYSQWYINDVYQITFHEIGGLKVLYSCKK